MVRGFAVVLCLLALTLGATPAGVTVALLSTFGGGLAQAAPGDIDVDALGSITVHKYAEPDEATGLPHDGSELAAADLTDLTPLAGVRFSVQQVTSIDLTTTEGWAAADGLTVAQVQAAPHTLGTATELATDDTGAARFGGLPVGVYLVTETDPGANPIAAPALPFLISIPMDIAGEWVYDLHAYPKNSLTTITKAVDDSTGIGLSSSLTWTITASVAQLPAG